MAYFWTSYKDLGSEAEITDGGYYEAIENSFVKRKFGTTVKSDIPQLCVSNSPDASLFAKIQSAQKTGVYYIYYADKEPDVKPSRTQLDFNIIEEYRYNMNKVDSIKFKLYTKVNVPNIVLNHIESCYEYAENESVNEILAESVKKGLQKLIEDGSYDEEMIKVSSAELFEEFADAYSVDMAENAYGSLVRKHNASEHLSKYNIED